MSDSTTSNSATSQRQRDPDFYMTLLTIQVEDCLFRVPCTVLDSQSPTFLAMHSLCISNDGEGMGATDDDPIRLSGVKADGFRLLLRVLLADILGPNIKPPGTPDEWIVVIQLAGKLGFDAVRSEAIQMVPYASVQKSPLEKLALALKLGIKEWLMPGFLEMAKRPEPIDKDDVELLGLEVALKIAAVRESLVLRTEISPEPTRSSSSKSSHRLSMPQTLQSQVTKVTRLASGVRNAEDVDFTDTIRRVFMSCPTSEL